MTNKSNHYVFEMACDSVEKMAGNHCNIVMLKVKCSSLWKSQWLIQQDLLDCSLSLCIELNMSHFVLKYTLYVVPSG